MRDILVPLDGSSFGEQALPAAVELARASGALLHLVHVHDSPVLPFSIEGYGAFDPVWSEAWRARASAYLEQQAAIHAEPAGVATALRLLEAPVVEALIEHIEQVGADLVVMTTHGRGGFSRVWLGSVADELVRHAGVPVLLLRPASGAAEMARRAALPSHVLVPLDGSPLAETALEPAVELARLSGARLSLLHVLPPMFAVGAPYGAAGVTFDADTYRLEHLRAERYLTGLVQRLRPEFTDVATMILTDPHPAAAIRNCARAGQVDLIALATHGRGGLSRWVIGSVADKVIRSGGPAVLAVRPAADVLRRIPAAVRSGSAFGT
jgi:nucleotide-binding universal stress UspA family protein